MNNLSFILLFKGGLGVGGGGGGLIFAIILIYWLYRKEEGDDLGCGYILMLPLLPIIWVVDLFTWLNKKGVEIADNAHYVQFDRPPSLLLKMLVAISAIVIYALVINMMVAYDVSGWWVALWGIMMPLVSINLYMLWLKVFFSRLGRMRTRTAVVICAISVLLIIVVMFFAIKVHNYYTSLEYLSGYWARYYGII